MGFLLLMILILIVMSEMARVQEKTKVEAEEAAKWCPPHKWRAKETKDSEGNVTKYSIVCELCGPLKPMD
jgi:hypothetical protein